MRERAGLFDLSHMGELWVERARGGRRPRPRAGHRSADVSRSGRAHYSMICAADGGIIDDLIVYRVGAGALPGRAQRVERGGRVGDARASASAASRRRLDDASLRTSLVAVQGPRAREILAPLTDVDLAVAQVLRDRGGPRRRHAGAGSRAPATRARTASSCSSTGTTRLRVWDDAAGRGPGRAASCPAAWARATRCGWRRACRSMATSSTATPSP